jgi:hypothetical protein
MAIDEIADGLYALPVEEFTQARNEAATELRKAGRPEDAEEVKALRKPTAVAGAVNRLVRQHRDEVEEYLAAAAALRDAQVAGKGDVAAATKRERETLDRVVRLAEGDVRQTLQAAAVDDEAAEQLRRGRLERELEPRGFGTLLAHARPAGTKAKPQAAKPKAAKQKTAKPAAKPEAAKPKPDDRAARASLKQAEETLAAARSEERQARRRWEQTQGDLAGAEAAVEQAVAELARLHGAR